MNEELKSRFAAALEYEKNGDISSSAAEYISILKIKPDHREACINLGTLYFKMNDYPGAEKYYIKALELREDYVTYFNLGCLYYRTGSYKRAVIHLEKSRKLNSVFYLSSLVKGLSFSRMKNIKAAEKSFLKVLRENPGNRIALTALAIIYYNENRFEESLDIFKQIDLNDGSSLKLNELKIDILEKLGKTDEAVTELKNLSKVSGGYIDYNNFVRSVPVEAYSDRYGSIDDKIEKLRQNSDEPGSLISLSLCHLLKGETETAIDYLYEAKKRSAS